MRILLAFLFCALSATAFAGEPLLTDYQQAYRKALSERKALIAVISADWCAACKRYKAELAALPGEDCQDVVIVVVDYDKDAELARSLADTTSLPVTAMFFKTPGDAYKRITGAGFFSLQGFRDKFLKPYREVGIRK